jgi:hypothetical protein
VRIQFDIKRHCIHQTYWLAYSKDTEKSYSKKNIYAKDITLESFDDYLNLEDKLAYKTSSELVSSFHRYLN